MLNVRPEQVDALAASPQADFERRALAHVRKHFADASAAESDAAVVERIRRCQARAARYQLTTQKQIICYVGMGYFLGEGFDGPGSRYPEMRQLLDAKEMDPTEKAGVALGYAMARRSAAKGGAT